MEACSILDPFAVKTIERRDRLIVLIHLWKQRQNTLEQDAVMYFREQNLTRISDLIFEKRDLQRKISRLEEFMHLYYAYE